MRGDDGSGGTGIEAEYKGREKERSWMRLTEVEEGPCFYYREDVRGQCVPALPRCDSG